MFPHARASIRAPEQTSQDSVSNESGDPICPWYGLISNRGDDPETATVSSDRAKALSVTGYAKGSIQARAHCTAEK